MESPLSFNSTENFRKKLITRNLRPYKVEGYFSYSEQLPISEIQIVDYSIIDSPPINFYQELKEPELIGLNKYSQKGGFGEVVAINTNLNAFSNFGEYDAYNQSIANNSSLEQKGDQQENLLRVLNKFNPENVSLGFGEPIIINVNKGTQSNFGEYSFTASAPNITTEQSQIISYLANEYGPEGKVNGFGEVVIININKQTDANKGEYDYTASAPERTIQQSRILAYVLNQYGPENLPNGYGNQEIFPHVNQNTKTNEGEYDYFSSEPNKTTEQSQSYAYIKNKYNTGDGSYDEITVEDLAQETINTPYVSSQTTFSFIPSEYNPVSIIQSENPSGSDGSLSQDSVLAQMAAKQLQKEFKARVAFELLQQTVGRTNLFTGEVDPATNVTTVRPNNDPFDALGIITNNIPIVQKNYKITGGPNSVANALSFTARLAGLYSPYSLIPGEYFDYPNKNFLSQATLNPIGAIAGAVGNLAQKISSLFIDQASEKFLSYTSDATKSLLFDQLFYNTYRPSYRFAGLSATNLLAPQSNFYVGITKNYIRDLVSPKVDLPKGRNNRPQDGPVYSYGEVGKDFEGNKIGDFLFGLNSRNLFDSVDPQGGFTWISKNNYIEPGTFVGPSNKKNILARFNTDSLFETSAFKPFFDKTKSTNVTFTDGSILDITQKLIDAGNKSTRKLEHVGNAINQVSKVFNDGYIELTKGSRVIRYVTPTSKKPNNEPSEVKGYEYCRLFTKDRPYYSYNELQKADGLIRSGGKSTYSILDKTYNLNIAPMRGEGSTNIDKKGRAKKYMFSLENLAWRTSSRNGFRVEDLPACEIGPNGGRIMWFPPYNLSFDEGSTAGWTDHTFLGRVEPIKTYKNTVRTGSISWSMVVDHSSVMNLLLDKELQNVKDNSEVTRIVDSFIAGCLKYDIYDLLKKYREFTLSDIYEVINELSTVEQYKDYFEQIQKPQVQATKSIDKTGQVNNNESQGQEDISKKEEFNEIILLFEQSEPKEDGFNEDESYQTYYDNLNSNDTKKLYLGDPSATPQLISQAPDKIIKYNSKKGSSGNNDFTDTLPNETQSFSYSEYVDARVSSLSGIFDFEEGEFSTFKEKFLPAILSTLKQGKKVFFNIEASANAGGSKKSNDKLSKRRLKTVENLIKNFESDGEKIKTYLDNKSLTYKSEAKGDVATIDETNYKDIDCSKDFNVDSYDGKYSVQAMLCRRVKISGLKVEDNDKENKKEQDSTTNVNEGTGINETAGEDNENVTPPSEQIKKQKVVTTQIKDKTNKLRAGLTKRLLRKLLTECNYFDMIQEQQPMVYDGIKSKFKNFHPVFHSTTPEGLNSRLTFLQQCVRPGDTIPTAVDNGQGGFTLQYNDAFNSAFGSPPILVLRIGDFFHTKIVPKSISLKYDDLKYDLNPEGIGVQPMMANVTLSFDFIGGHGIAEPIAKLQNGLSFNFYANTEIYDERADETENFLQEIDDEILKSIQDEVGDIDPNKPRQNDGGDTIGTIESSFADINTNLISGRINYKEVMNQLIDKTADMVNGFNQTLVNIIVTRAWGGLIMLTKDRKYSEGLFDYLSGDTSNKVNIIGKPVNYQEKIDDLFQKTNQDVDDETIPILGGLQLKKEFKNQDTRKIKRKIKEILEKQKTLYQSQLDKFANDLVKNQLEFIKITDKINFVSNQLDGRENKRGGVNIYNISGTTPADISSNGAPTTYEELKNDFLKIRTDLNDYNQILKTYQLIPNGDKNVYNSDYLFNLYLMNKIESNEDDSDVSVFDRRFAMTLGDLVVENSITLVDEIVSVIDERIAKENWRNFILKNLGYNILGYDATPNMNQGLYLKIKNSFDKLGISIFKDKYTNDEVYKRFFGSQNELNYKPYNRDKLRKFTYVSQDPIVPPNDDNLRAIWSNVESTWDYFNLKRQMK
jgi:hypothetical protein